MYKMKTELTRNMYILLSKFAKENNIKMEDKEFISALKSVFMNIVHNSTKQVPVRNTNFSKLHEKIMQQCIDFVKENPDVKQAIEDKVNIIREDLKNKVGGLAIGLDPDVRISFGADSFDESIKEGIWVPSTDSYLLITAGNEPVIESI